MGHALSALLLVITIGSLLLQLRTVRRVGTAGLAPSTWFGLLASTLVWLGYGVAMREVTVIVINVLVLAVGIALTVAIVRNMSIPVVRLVPYVVAPASVCAGAWVADAPWLLGVAGTMLVVGRLVPQLVGALVATDRSGISREAWLGNGITNVAWAAYGFSTGDPFVSWPSVVSAALSCTIVVLASRRDDDWPRATHEASRGVDAIGFEPTTPSLRTRCSARLSHAPGSTASRQRPGSVLLRSGPGQPSVGPVHRTDRADQSRTASSTLPAAVRSSSEATASPASSSAYS